MAVKVVTDSVADIPVNIVADLDITVVPLLLRFGNEEFRDGVDITVDEFYTRLRTSSDFPTTSFPPITDYARVYDEIADMGSQVFVVTVSAALSGVYGAAKSAISTMNKETDVRVFDSRCATMIEGFVAIRAAEAARAGATLQEVEEVAVETSRKVDMLTTFRTLEYLHRGGRIGAAKALMGKMTRLHPFIKLKDGLVAPAGVARTRDKAIERLLRFATDYKSVEMLAVEHTECPEEAARLVKGLSDLCERDHIYVSTMTPVIGAHTGPGLLLVGVLGQL